MEHDGLKGCMNILAFCAMEDPLAADYLRITKVFENALSAANVKLQSETFPTTSDSAVDPSQHNDCSTSNWPLTTNQALVPFTAFDPAQYVYSNNNGWVQSSPFRY
jgi:uncharacterized membrane protein